MTRKVINASLIFTAALALLGGCSKGKEQPAKETAPTQSQASQPAPEAQSAKPAEAAKVTPKDEATRPQLDYFPRPTYPIPMLARCEEGEARVTMRVTPEGKAEDIKVTESTNSAFSDALMDVVPSWRFKPAQKDGVAVARTVSIAIPFIINNRPVDLPNVISHGQPELLGVTRPPHPGKGPAQALVQFTIASDTLVRNVDIISTEGTVDRGSMMETLSQWVFLPSRFSKHLPQTKVMAEITFTAAGNVLIQYPYPTPVIPTDGEDAAPQQ